MKNKIVFFVTSCRESGPIHQMLNLIKYIDHRQFDLYMITIYPEEGDLSRLDLFLPMVRHEYIPMSKIDIILGSMNTLRKRLEEISPDVIHSWGTFPNLAITRIGKYKQLTTIRGYIYEDFFSKFGKIKGGILAAISRYAFTHTDCTLTCSKSLSYIYKERLGYDFDYIQNGVDTDNYTKSTVLEKMKIRKELELPTDAFFFVYTGQLIERKNMDFLLSTFTDTFKGDEIQLLVLGGGAEYDILVEKYGKFVNVDFRGMVNNVNSYLKACDVYVSCSKSEGLPNGVMEAMCVGLPVVLSDIVQHKEFFEVNDKIGYLYDSNSKDDFSEKLKQMVAGGAEKAGEVAYEIAHTHFTASRMSKQYQNKYMSLINSKK